MPPASFLIFELISYLLFLLCLRHAWRRATQGQPALVLRLLLGVVFGVLLELATIRQLNAYQYGRFLVMVLDVPLCIGVGWGTIIYSVMEFSDASSLNYWLRPILDGLLALNIDLAMDAIAIRLGFWDWGAGLEFQYFGVPYANFWAWFWVVASFSSGFRLLARRPGWTGQWLPSFLALVFGLIGVLSTNAFIVFVVPGMWVPFILHLELLVLGIASGVIFQPPALLWISLSMLLISLLLHRQSLQALWAKRTGSAGSAA